MCTSRVASLEIKAPNKATRDEDKQMIQSRSILFKEFTVPMRTH